MDQKSRSSRAAEWDQEQSTMNKGAAAGREPEEQKSRSSKSTAARA